MSLMTMFKGAVVALAISVIGATSASAVTVNYNESVDGNINNQVFTGVTGGTIAFRTFRTFMNDFEVSVGAPNIVMTVTIEPFINQTFTGMGSGEFTVGGSTTAYDLYTGTTVLTYMLSDADGLISIVGGNTIGDDATDFTLSFAYIPVPAGLVLMLGGLGVLGAMRARKALA